jgi:AcrR family transcriptional regulator
MATKQLMLDIALDLFSENGVKGTSIRMITSKAGLSTASFYNHFSSKDELLKTMYEHYTMQHAKNGGVLYDYEEMLEMIGPIGLFEYLRESMAASFANEKLIKLTRVILMEQYTNETARDITMKDKALLIYLTEQMFVSMKEKGMIDVPDAALMGKIVGYAYLGFASENGNYFLENGEAPPEKALEQGNLIIDYLKSVVVEKYKNPSVGSDDDSPE